MYGALFPLESKPPIIKNYSEPHHPLPHPMVFIIQLKKGIYIVSWEPEGRYCRSKMFRWEPEGRYCHWRCTAIAPFWFSMEHLWAAITPFWLSTDDIYKSERENCMHNKWGSIHAYISSSHCESKRKRGWRKPLLLFPTADTCFEYNLFQSLTTIVHEWRRYLKYQALKLGCEESNYHKQHRQTVTLIPWGCAESAVGQMGYNYSRISEWMKVQISDIWRIVSWQMAVSIKISSGHLLYSVEHQTGANALDFVQHMRPCAWHVHCIHFFSFLDASWRFYYIECDVL